MRRYLKLILAAILPACIFGCRGSAPATPSTDAQPDKPLVQVTFVEVTRHSVEDILAVTGTLAPLPGREAKVAPSAPGKLQAVYVKPGDSVTRGQLLASLDSEQAAAALQGAKAGEQAAQQTLGQVRLNLEAQKRTQSASLIAAKTNVRMQEVALEKLLAGARPEEILQAQLAVAAANASLTASQQNLSRSRTLFAQDLLARKDLENAEAQEKTAMAQVRGAEAALQLAQKGNRAQDIEAGRVAVRQAKEQLAAVESQSIMTSIKARDVETASRQLQASRATVRGLTAQLNTLTLRAPLSGTVIARAANPGESVDVTAAVVTIADLRRLRVNLSVPASKVSSIQLGETVRFTVESRPRHLYSARVALIGRSVDPAANTVAVECEADNPAGELRDDGAVRAEIVLATHQNAVCVPKTAVVEKSGKTVVFVDSGTDSVKMQPVVTGFSDGNLVEAVSGLRPGEKVVAEGAYEMEDGMKVKAQK